MSLTPQPQVTIKPHFSTDPKIEVAIDEIKVLVTGYGCVTIPDYMEVRDRNEVTDEQLLPLLQEAGYGFVKTSAVNAGLEQEVIMDLRYMAAAMLLIYSDPKFALSHSVLECLKTFYNYGSWPGGVCVYDELVADAYAAYGHHFSYMAMADAADLSDEAHATYADPDSHHRGHSNIVARNIPALNELVKDEAELTAVFRLCVDVMHIVNNGLATGKMFRTYHGDSKAYNYFWRMACKLRDNARYKEKQAHPCGGESCCGQCKH